MYAVDTLLLDSMDSSSDESVFLTQNSFQEALDYSTDTVVDDILNIMEDTEPSEIGNKYSVKISDISDEELLASAEALETSSSTEPVSTSVKAVTVARSSAATSRFSLPKSDEEIARIQSRRFADATMTKIRWATRAFRDWQANRNDAAERMDISPINVDIDDMTKDELNYSISRFICETKKVDGTNYPADTLYSFVICLQLYMSTLDKDYKFLSDDGFSQIRCTLDNIMKDRSKVRVPKKQAQEISTEEEEILWSTGCLGSDNPEQLLNTLFYLIGLNFALRGGQEHRNLRRGSQSQFTVGENREGRYLSYTEDVSKSNQGGLKHRKIQPKQVIAYENVLNPNRCVLRLFELYCSLCPEITHTDALYLKPLSKPKDGVWFVNMPLGRHKLASIIASVCRAASLPGYRTNHSLRASAASRMYRAGMDEQLISEVTGHRSTAVRNYKRTTEVQKREVSEVIQGKSGAAVPPKRARQETTADSDDNRNVTVTVNINVK